MPSFGRFRRGSSPFNRSVYGWEVTCECMGFSKRVNGDKEEARSWHNDHLNRDVS